MRMGLNGLTVEAKSAIVVALGFSALPLTQCHMLWASFNIGALESWRNHAAARCTQFIYEVQTKSLSVIIDAWVEVVLLVRQVRVDWGRRVRARFRDSDSDDIGFWSNSDSDSS